MFRGIGSAVAGRIGWWEKARMIGAAGMNNGLSRAAGLPDVAVLIVDRVGPELPRGQVGWPYLFRTIANDARQMRYGAAVTDATG